MANLRGGLKVAPTLISTRRVVSGKNGQFAWGRSENGQKNQPGVGVCKISSFRGGSENCEICYPPTPIFTSVGCLQKYPICVGVLKMVIFKTYYPPTPIFTSMGCLQKWPICVGGESSPHSDFYPACGVCKNGQFSWGRSENGQKNQPDVGVCKISSIYQFLT